MEVQGRAKLERAANGKVAGFLWGTLWQRHKWMLMVSLFLQAIYSAFNFSGPVILSKIVTFLGNNKLYTAQLNNQLVSDPRSLCNAIRLAFIRVVLRQAHMHDHTTRPWRHCKSSALQLTL